MVPVPLLATPEITTDSQISLPDIVKKVLAVAVVVPIISTVVFAVNESRESPLCNQNPIEVDKAFESIGKVGPLNLNVEHEAVVDIET